MRRTGCIDAPSATAVPWTLAWLLVYVFAFMLVCPLSIYLLCTLRFGGQMAVTWTEPRVLGLSLHTLASLVNGLLLVLVFATLFGSGRSRRASIVTLVTASLVTAGLQVTLNGWKGVADRDVANVLARGRTAEEHVARIASELSSLKEHPWAGRYRGEWDGGAVRFWFAPESGWVSLWRGPDYSEDASDARRAIQSSGSYGPLIVVENGFRKLHKVGFGGIEYYPVAWGERRYLVATSAVQRFWDDARAGGDASLDYRILVREGDAAKPVTGLPALPPELVGHLRNPPEGAK